jgi:hypothetical protein
MMEKHGVIKSGITPPEHEPEKTAAQINNKKPSVTELDDDFRKRAAEAAREARNK